MRITFMDMIVMPGKIKCKLCTCHNIKFICMLIRLRAIASMYTHWTLPHLLWLLMCG